ncbi:MULTISPECIES: TetR/AcrR family transcriptional regulator [Nocardioides]|uniref:TetR/AcrR family transcriptional regulator n=1 Tax=Nocardioides vastitatis TaxID=2568655 RepID=A0ABW0ZJQ5_9ACTN|nr:TetR/AcrR family transcriptional regulator [Nocardioides sp.]THI94057.1 TetR/AcrR family transcriptional regulator [Nocardioides sp.]
MAPRAASHGSPEHVTRPRVEGDREQEILDATLDVLAEAGYDRLTMDAVAARAKASKATLYRRWNGKAALVIDALISQKPAPALADTGSLRGDLLAAFCGMGGMTDRRQMAILGSLITAISRDEEFAEAFRRDFIGPKAAVTTAIYQQAIARGEIRPEIDLDILLSVLPGILLHRMFMLGEIPTEDVITAVIDHVIIPAAANRG